MDNAWTTPRRRQRSTLRALIAKRGRLIVAAGVSTAAVLCMSPSPAGASGESAATGPQNLTTALAAIENHSRYEHSTWGYQVVDQKTGKVVAAQNAQSMFDPGSTMKIYSSATALRLYGPNYRFTTPAYRQGTMSGGTLNGNLVLVGTGDLSLGLRDQPNGTMYYESLPDLDQSYADISLPGAVEPPGNPLAGLNQIAAKVRASGITQVNGNVVVDNRLFTPYDGFPDGEISPIWVNENLIDALVTPGAVGKGATVNWRPMTAQYTVANQVTTVDAKGSTSLQITEPTPGNLVATGQIAAGSAPTLVVHEVDDPAAFARSAFIEALQQAGVTVAAAPAGPNPENLLPPKGSLQPSDMVGDYVSPPLSQFINLILKVSYNRGADLMTCLAAVKVGSTDCQQGLVPELATITKLGVPAQSVFPFDGAGSDDQGRTTTAAMATFLRRAASTSYGPTLYNALPVLGRNGTLANDLPRSSVAGHAQVKTGNRAVGSATNQLILLGNSLAGYLETKSGRRVTFMIAVGNVPIASGSGVLEVTDEQAQMVAAMYKDL
jgi:D-alanyl-D-alanine carboxypeptidase/D-alanyl-D-alanine-endopeptidase (penicillin-binding protein 4)